MNVSSMRSIDRWAGIPLCFILGNLNRVWKAITFSKTAIPDVQNTLFIELSEMGSAIIVDPAMRNLQERGKANLFFMIFKDNVKSLYLLNTVSKDHIFCMRSANMFVLVLDIFRYIVWCRKNHITTVIDLELFSRFTALLSLMSGAGARIGFNSHHDEGLYRGGIMNFPVRYNPHVHMSVNFMSLVNRALGMHHNPYSTTPVNPEELKLAKVKIDQKRIQEIKNKILKIYPSWTDQKIVLLNVNASDLLPQRRWMPEKFAEVAGKLLEKYDDIVILATGAQRKRTTSKT